MRSTRYVALLTTPWQAKLDVPLLTKIAGMLQDMYEDGLPRHWNEASSDPILHEGASSLFRIDCKKFNQMSPSQIQEVHRHRHLLVTGLDSGRQVNFDADGLQMLADIDAEVFIQRMNIPPVTCFLKLT